MALEDNTKENIVSTKSTGPKKMKLSLSLDFRLLAGVLLAVIVVMLVLWKPWQAQPKASDRTISVTGQATITSTPDQYVFYPSYSFKSADKQTALDAMTKQSDTIVAKLKQLGVADNKIKSDSSGYNNSIYSPAAPIDEGDGTTAYNLNITVTVGDKILAQKVEDYLASTSPTGGVSPSADFSDAKTKVLQSQGRDMATKDARAKADQSAKNLGFKINGIKSVDDSGFGGGCSSICPLSSTGVMKTDVAEASPSNASLSIQSGESQVNYTVRVVYYIH